MHRVEAKLALWKNRYLALGEAHVKLAEAMVHPADAASIEALKAEVERLQRETAEAREAVQAQIANTAR